MLLLGEVVRYFKNTSKLGLKNPLYLTKFDHHEKLLLFILR